MTRSIPACALVLVLASVSATAQFRTVTVQNSNSNPVPTNIQSMPPVTVSGTVEATIANTPSVNATITGTPSVTVTGTPTVSVTNLPTGTAGPAATTALLVKSLDNPAEQPFQLQLNCVLDRTTVCGTTFTSPGKMLVLEYLNMTAGVISAGSNPTYFSLAVSANSSLVNYYYPPGTQVVPGFYFSEHLVKIYILPGSTVEFIGGTDSNAGNVRDTVILSGHLVNVP